MYFATTTFVSSGGRQRYAAGLRLKGGSSGRNIPTLVAGASHRELPVPHNQGKVMTPCALTRGERKSPDTTGGLGNLSARIISAHRDAKQIVKASACESPDCPFT